MLFLAMIKEKIKKIKPKAANDNRHNKIAWIAIHQYLDLWFEKNNVPKTGSRYNRALHYMYEMRNRPWLHENDCHRDAFKWLDCQAKDWHVSTVWPGLD
ncbi:hypothetical protein [Runella zeae]|uniref:hypothetical protein n=1 Tax=Runella zeae TaxID=94255 RepID=UPI0004915EEF|nr:hypothetical protein [Runella zeae]